MYVMYVALHKIKTFGIYTLFILYAFTYTYHYFIFFSIPAAATRSRFSDTPE